VCVLCVPGPGGRHRPLHYCSDPRDMRLSGIGGNDASTHVIAMTLLGLGASSALLLWRQRSRQRAMFSAGAAASGAAAAAAPDPTHRDSNCEAGTELLRQFREQGYVIVTDLFTAAEMKEWKANIRAQLQRWPQRSVDPSTGREVAAAVTGVSVWMARGDASLPTSCPPFFARALTAPKLGAVLRQILGEEVELLSTKPVLKTGKIRHASPWHQDFPYWQGTNKVSLWIAIDDASVGNGCLKIVPCSHRAVLPHEEHCEAIGALSAGAPPHPPSLFSLICPFDWENFPYAAAVSGLLASETEEPNPPCPAFDSRASAPSDAEVLDVELSSGSVIIFHDLLLHASNPNVTGADRYCMIPTYRSRRDEDPDPLGVWPVSWHFHIVMRPF
jgi:phytanoyl-CoA hydroxylase